MMKKNYNEENDYQNNYNNYNNYNNEIDYPNDYTMWGEIDPNFEVYHYATYWGPQGPQGPQEPDGPILESNETTERTEENETPQRFRNRRIGNRDNRDNRNNDSTNSNRWAVNVETMYNLGNWSNWGVPIWPQTQQTQQTQQNINNFAFEIINEASDIYFPASQFIERLFNDYLENKNRLNNEEFQNSIIKLDEKLEECPICFKESDTTIKILKCNHLFCENCIQSWLIKYKNTCPVCRTVVVDESEQTTNSNNSTNFENSTIFYDDSNSSES